MKPPHKAIKFLLWVYLVLLIVEGSLRKWFLPGLADPLLVIRDPVVMLIYGLALTRGLFPSNLFVLATGALAVFSVLLSVFAGQTNLLVTAYGLRVNYLHLPLIWVMGAVLNRRDVERIGVFFLLVAIPMTWVMVMQFKAPMDAWINRGVGGEETGQIFGADGRIRPPGLFSFISGPQLFYPLCVAFFFDQLSRPKRMPWYLLLPCGLALAIALPVSISRTVMVGALVVAVVFVISLPFTSSRASALVKPMLLLAVLGIALSQLPIFKEGSSVFMMRWEQAAHENDGKGWGNVLDRSVAAFTNVLYFVEQAPFFGHGIGMGSNVGARLTSGGVGFLLAEEEWGKVLLELGPVLGMAFILLRVVLSAQLGLLSWQALREQRNALPLLIWSALMIAILQGQWGPPTVLGFAVIGGGLILGAMNPVEETVPETAETVMHIEEPLLAHPTHANLPVASSRRPPFVIRSVQK
jgi:hypothetical protein